MPTIDIDEFDPLEGISDPPPALDSFNGVFQGHLEVQVPPPAPSIITPPPAPVQANMRTLAFNLSKDMASDDSVRIATHHTGEWFDWRYDTFAMTKAKLNKMMSNFKSKVLHPNAPVDKQIALQAGHGFLGEPPALGWAVKMELEKDGSEWMLWTTFKLTEQGKKSVSSGEYAFVSPSYTEDYEEQRVVGGERKLHGPTLLHVALTNSPVLAELPNIALSKTYQSSYDVRFFKPQEVKMDEPVEPTVVVPPVVDLGVAPPAIEVTPPAAQTTAPVVTPPAPVELASTPPAASQPTASGGIVLSEAEYRTLMLNIETTNRRLTEERIRSHNLEVGNRISEAAARGVPPAILDIVGPIMLGCHPEAQRTVDLAVGTDGERHLNVYEALAELLVNAPTVQLGRLTSEPTGKKPDTVMSSDEAIAAGKELWANSGIVPSFLNKGVV